ncbi:MAG TPA: hypothetical protein VN887_06550, partial [Candidatus Angelobacter sp.]|nr:hypothetical protein [Candidatus Angelobacter sp.]
GYLIASVHHDTTDGFAALALLFVFLGALAKVVFAIIFDRQVTSNGTTQTMTRCSCGSLKLWARDPDVPVSFDENSDTYVLELSHESHFKMPYCFICGGLGVTGEGKGFCSCGLLERWATDSKVAVEFDAKFNEYHVLYGKGWQLMLYYCPGCGGRLPKSKRGEFFEKPSEMEVDEFRTKLKKLKTIEEVIAVLGASESESGPSKHTAIQKELYKLKDSKRTLWFYPAGKTFIICVQEFEDGELGISFTARSKEQA